MIANVLTLIGLAAASAVVPILISLKRQDADFAPLFMLTFAVLCLVAVAAGWLK